MTYIETIRSSCTRPTPTQVANFVDYVADAHSWYKHLPTFGSGAPFYFYMNPVAGLARRRDIETKELEFLVKEEGEQFFHYNEMSTDKYLDQFGKLSFSCNRGTVLLFRKDNYLINDKSILPKAFTPDGQEIEIPIQILEKGICFLTGTLSQYYGRHHIIRLFYIQGQEYEEVIKASVSPSVYNMLLEFEQLRQENSLLKASEKQKEVLDTLIVEDRNRNKKTMEEAINNMLKSIYS